MPAPWLGAQLDAWRVQQLWQLYPRPGAWPRRRQLDAVVVLWRRVAAGPMKSNKCRCSKPWLAVCKTVERTAWRAGGSYDDMLRLFAAMEAVPWEYRQEMGQWMLQRLQRPDEPAHLGAIGRFGARAVWPTRTASCPRQRRKNFAGRAGTRLAQNEHAMFAAVHIARKTGERIA